MKLDHEMTFIYLEDVDPTIQLVTITLNKKDFPDRYLESYQIRAEALESV